MSESTAHRPRKTPPEGLTRSPETNWRGYREVQQFQFNEPIQNLHILPDRSFVALTHSSGIELIDPTQNAQATLIDPMSGGVGAITITPEGLVVYLQNDFLHTIDPQTCEKKRIGHVGYTYDKPKFIATKRGPIVMGTTEGWMRIWNDDNAYPTSVEPPPAWGLGIDSIEDIAESPHDGTIIAGTRDGKIARYDIRQGSCIDAIKNGLSHVSSVGALPDGTAVWVESYQNEVNLVIGNKSDIISLNPDTFRFGADILATTPDGYILLPDRDGTIHVFNPAFKKEEGIIGINITNGPIRYAFRPIVSILPQPDGTIVVGTSEGLISVFQRPSEEVTQSEDLTKDARLVVTEHLASGNIFTFQHPENISSSHIGHSANSGDKLQIEEDHERAERRRTKNREKQRRWVQRHPDKVRERKNLWLKTPQGREWYKSYRRERWNRIHDPGFSRLNARQSQLINELAPGDSIAPREYRERWALSRGTCGEDLRQLAKLGFLTSEGWSTSRRYKRTDTAYSTE